MAFWYSARPAVQEGQKQCGALRERVSMWACECAREWELEGVNQCAYVCVRVCESVGG